LQIGRRAHVADLRLAVVQRVDHVGAGIHHAETGIHALLLEEALLRADEHRQMAEIVGNHHVELGQVCHGNLLKSSRGYDFASTCGLTQFGGTRPSMNAWMLSATIFAICSRTSTTALPRCGVVTTFFIVFRTCGIFGSCSKTSSPAPAIFFFFS